MPKRSLRGLNSDEIRPRWYKSIINNEYVDLCTFLNFLTVKKCKKFNSMQMTRISSQILNYIIKKLKQTFCKLFAILKNTTVISIDIVKDKKQTAVKITNIGWLAFEYLILFGIWEIFSLYLNVYDHYPYFDRNRNVSGN